eukprot:CAMPEP_0113305652 /NCGR_PEP_ID=MMETSP0010_2-20120614/5198_1 /TAXON_ID=216773 ORGANISM="Corethron hystrix, Strain 308" /NCGR_SAMPLE_ID=MMETSP0010_2 /ASSEMBLY_ACC=CAM_ASM_000155 /LENGTH=196 /DNA_ID=CAMNT_0000160123 /DNA_START=59 /DNA_END=649 /DNA_ORIENTATION=+ /assembly_acc=CAM_ASM_000155
MKLAILSLIAGTAAAFAPSASVGRCETKVAAFENELGVINPTGFWDPCGLTENIDQATFDQYRTAELKHGRVAMLCTIGYIVPEFYRFPGVIASGVSFADIPNGVAAIDAIPPLGWFQMVFFIGAVDYWGFLGDFEVGKPKLSPEKLAKAQLQELQHGRLAMLATMELLRHDSQELVSPGFDGLPHLINGIPALYN